MPVFPTEIWFFFQLKLNFSKGVSRPSLNTSKVSSIYCLLVMYQMYQSIPWKTAGYDVRRLALLLNSTIVRVFWVSMVDAWVGAFGWTRVTEVGCRSSLRRTMEIRGTIQTVRFALVLWLLVAGREARVLYLLSYQWFCMFRPLTIHWVEFTALPNIFHQGLTHLCDYIGIASLSCYLLSL